MKNVLKLLCLMLIAVMSAGVVSATDYMTFKDEYHASVIPTNLAGEPSTVLNPANNNELFMWYSMSNDTTWFARSTDGITFTSNQATDIPEGLRVYVCYMDSHYYAYVTNHTAMDTVINCYVSDNMINFTLVGPAITKSSTVGAWDYSHVANSCVWKENGTYYMLYEGNNATNVWKMGLATGTGPANFTKNANNPFFDFDSGNPEILQHNGVPVKVDGFYRMYYHTQPWEYRAKSTDLVNWTVEGKVQHTYTPLGAAWNGASGWCYGDVSYIAFKNRTFMYFTPSNQVDTSHIDVAISNKSYAALNLSDKDFQTLTVNSTSDLTGYPMTVTLSNASGTSAGSVVYTNGSCANDWGDVKFNWSVAGVDQGVRCPFWINLASQTTNTVTAYVKVPYIYANNTSGIKLISGSDLATTIGNGEQTFSFFDSFDGTAINTTKWTAAGSVSVSDGIATIAGAEGSLVGKTSFTGNYTAVNVVKMPLSTTSNYATFGMENASQYVHFVTGASEYGNPAVAFEVYGVTPKKTAALSSAIGTAYQNVEIYKTGNTIGYKQNGVDVYSAASATLTAPLFPRIYAVNAGSRVYYDSIFVKNNAVIEPTLTLRSEVIPEEPEEEPQDPVTQPEAQGEFSTSFVSQWQSVLSMVSVIILIALVSHIIAMIRGKGKIEDVVTSIQGIVLVLALILVGTGLFDRLLLS
ncbi:DUF2341 domain-containing protein [Methanosarcina sp. Z-7115]|uniref:DUF2341 domain-containing protein n=1 Tax=Methanosarcina baikalica TaxID=3073890 RepID=A0ABU2D0I4_9EURY|nr:DUF2341 domain-containing protein [Methanosarcina sp. Z-7115]MDR7665500.1 DUF2341 domain-containing protein [Methanosarcina sp. Z-7115]